MKVRLTTEELLGAVELIRLKQNEDIEEMKRIIRGFSGGNILFDLSDFDARGTQPIHPFVLLLNKGKKEE